MTQLAETGPPKSERHILIEASLTPLRFRVPEATEIEFQDLVYGKVRVQTENLADFHHPSIRRYPHVPSECGHRRYQHGD